MEGPVISERIIARRGHPPTPRTKIRPIGVQELPLRRERRGGGSFYGISTPPPRDGSGVELRGGPVTPTGYYSTPGSPHSQYPSRWSGGPSELYALLANLNAVGQQVGVRVGCPLCGSPIIRDYRYKLQDAFRCGPSRYEARGPRGYFDEALRKCAGPAGELPLPPSEGGRPRRFHGLRCRQAAYRRRQRKSRG